MQVHQTPRRRGSLSRPLWRLLSRTLLVPWLLVAPPVLAEDASEPAPPEPAAPQAAPGSASDRSGRGGAGIGLERLLRPRGTLDVPVQPQLPGGRDREAWEQAFADVRREIRELELGLDKARAAIGDRSGGAYQYSPIGGETPSDPEVLKLRAQIRRDRKSLEAAESRLRDLQVEASLSGVPEEWTREPTPPPAD